MGNIHMCDCAFCESCGTEVGDTLVHVRVPIKRRNKERKVIEAAKRYRVELAGGYDGEAASAHKKLLLAVEALQEARDE